MSLQSVLTEELRDLYSAENQLVKALPKMAKGSSDPELKNLFTEHLQQTKGHVERLKTDLPATRPKAYGQALRRHGGPGKRRSGAA